MVIVGLGNPGSRYEKTRHNVGFMCVDVLANRMAGSGFSDKSRLHAHVLKYGNTVLVKPQTFMNDSGQAVRAVMEYFTDWRSPQPVDELYVVHDDLDLEIGAYKIQFGTGPKQHNGLLSIYDHMGTNQFWHVRIGVDGRAGDRSMPPDQYVLQPPSSPEQLLLGQVLTQVVAELNQEMR